MSLEARLDKLESNYNINHEVNYIKLTVNNMNNKLIDVQTIGHKLDELLNIFKDKNNNYTHSNKNNKKQKKNINLNQNNQFLEEMSVKEEEMEQE